MRRQMGTTVATYALGSCVGLVLYDPRATVGGMLHVLLPDSRYRSATREFNPYMFADTGFAALLEMVLALGATRQRLVAKLAGGANMLKHSAVLDIGQRNSEALISLLQSAQIPVLASSIGGTVGRSMLLHLNNGTINVRVLGVGEEVL